MRPTHVTSILRNIAASAAVLVVALALPACSTSSNSPGPRDSSAPEPRGSSSPSSTSAQPSQAANVVKLNGVAVTLPAGWHEADPTLCGPAEANTVTRYPKPMPVAPCPRLLGTQKDVPSIQLVAMFGPWGANASGGTRTTWDGQPAWVTQATATGRTPAPGSTEPLTTALTLPWLNVTVVARVADAATMKQLLGHVSALPQSDLAVPASASSMSVGYASLGQQTRTSKSAAVITATLSALRELPAMSEPEACQAPTTLGPVAGAVVVTFQTHTGQVSFLVNSAPCDQVTSGTGVAGKADDALRSALSQVPPPALR
jgi:hypothetical protein